MTATRQRLAPVHRRRQIMDSARQLYADRPYDQVSIAELAAAAGVTRGLINYYFGDKRAVFLAVMRESMIMPPQPLPDLDDDDVPQRARLVMAWILDAATAEGQTWFNASGTADLHGVSDLQMLVDDADDRAARLVLDAMGLPEDAHLRARLRPVASLTKAVCREWLHRGTFTRDEALDLLTETVLRFVQPGGSR